MVVDLIHAQGEEVGEHHFHHRLEPGKRQADRCAGHACLADGCRDHSTREVGGQTLRDLERAAIGIVQILAEQQHLGDRRQQVPQGCIDRLAHILVRDRAGVADARIGQRGGAEDVRRHVTVASLGRRLGAAP